MRLARLVYWPGWLIGLAVTLAGLCAPLVPRLDMLNHFRPYTLVGCFGLIGLGLLAWRRQWPKAALGLAAFNLVLIAPALLMTATTAGQGERIKVLSINLWVSRDYDAVVRLVESVEPDLVMLQEVRDSHVANLLPRLRSRFPHVAKSYYDVALLSRRPLTDIEVQLHTTDGPAIVSASWTSPSGKAYRVGSLHVAWPFRPETQVRHVGWLIDAVAAWGQPVILAGDFNLTPWSYQLNRLTWRSGLRRHGLVGFSWPSRDAGLLPPPMVLIDNVLTSPEVSGERFQVHGDVGSDHRPVSVELSLPR